MVTIAETLDAWVRAGLIERWCYSQTFLGQPGIMIYGKKSTEVTVRVR